MFHRRLLLLLLSFCAPLCLCGVQLARLTLIHGNDLRSQAESRLVRTRQTPTVRGNILDRKGRVLARDKPAYDVCVDFRVIDGSWATEQARRAAAQSAGSGWGSLSREAREDLVSSFLPVYKMHVEAGWDRLARATGVSRAIIDAARDEVLQRVNRRREAVIRSRLSAEESRWEGREIPESERRAMLRRAQAPIAEQTRAHVLIAGVDDGVAFACMTLAAEVMELALPAPTDRLALARREVSDLVEAMPGLEVRDSGAREYPAESARVRIDRSTFPLPARSDEPLQLEIDGVLTHVVGSMRETVHAEDSARRAMFLEDNPSLRTLALEGGTGDRGAYREGDHVGSSGVEFSQEHVLRGLRGVRRTSLDTGRRADTPPVRGRDVQLTIDVALQARIQGVMDPRAGLAVVRPWHRQTSPTQKVGDPLYGASVVLDIDTGDILALVTTPTHSRREVAEHWNSLVTDVVNTPLINRPVAKVYTPGSIVKPLILCEAAKRGLLAPGDRIACTGHLLADRPDLLRCWIFKQFGTTHNAILGHNLSAEDAIMVSCNIFFYTLGQRLGAQGIIGAFESFGVGRSFDLGVGGETGGRVGFHNRSEDRGISVGDATVAAIGQGPVVWTPLHAAQAYATLARGGVWVPPRLIAGSHRGEPSDLALPPWAVDASMNGLEAGVGSRYGTGHHMVFDGVEDPVFNARGVRIWGKTGTAAAPRILAPRDSEQPPEVLEEGDHSWFVVMVGRDRPRYVIAVVIDYGGSGGRVSGPIANQIIHALIAEGYLE
jgi:penicillin-binding protein 2